MSTAFFQFRQILQKLHSIAFNYRNPAPGAEKNLWRGWRPISVKLVLDIRTQLRYNLNKRISNPARGLARRIYYLHRTCTLAHAFPIGKFCLQLSQIRIKISRSVNFALRRVKIVLDIAFALWRSARKAQAA